VMLPDADRPDRATLVALVASQRESVARALGVDPPPRVTLRVHDSTDSYERASGQPWFTLGAVTRGEIQLVPLWMLRERGMLERTIRHQLVHVMADPMLQGRSMWVREGAAAYFADPEARVAARPPCPPDIELQRPTSPGALADSWARARGCFERELAGSRDWRKVR
jgi:hypothetical protein